MTHSVTCQLWVKDKASRLKTKCDNVAPCQAYLTFRMMTIDEWEVIVAVMWAK